MSDEKFTPQRWNEAVTLYPSNKPIILTNGIEYGNNLFALVKVNRKCTFTADECFEVGERPLCDLVKDGSIIIIECNQIDIERTQVKDGNDQIKYYLNLNEFFPEIIG